MEEKRLEELNLHINTVLNEIHQMTKDLSRIDSFSHYNTLTGALAPAGLFGALRENAEQKKLMQYLSTKIYKDMSFDEIGYKIVEFAEDLANTQVEVQKNVSTTDDCYYGNVKSIIDALEKCKKTWEAISPKVAMEELKCKDGTTLQLGPQIEYWMQCEFVKMDIPKEYDRIKKSIKKAQDGSGCIFTILILITSFLAACSML